jgi:uncharacterized damage-inducible protein DinB
MSFSSVLLPEFDREMAITRRTLERAPEEKFAWKPHEKSMTLGRLASHLAEIPTLANATVNLDSFHINAPGAPPRQAKLATSRKELLEWFDTNVAAARAAIAGASDEHLKHPWTLLLAGKELLSMPRIGALRTLVVSHTIHHRAQLGVYLRLNDVPVPSVYGPSADEPAQ